MKKLCDLRQILNTILVSIFLIFIALINLKWLLTLSWQIVMFLIHISAVQQKGWSGSIALFYINLSLHRKFFECIINKKEFDFHHKALPQNTKCNEISDKTCFSVLWKNHLKYISLCLLKKSKVRSYCFLHILDNFCYTINVDMNIKIK